MELVPDIGSFISSLVVWLTRLFDELNSCELSLGNVFVGLGDLLVSFGLFGIVLSVLWKGAKS